jgi:hypothetical protein
LPLSITQKIIGKGEGEDGNSNRKKIVRWRSRREKAHESQQRKFGSRKRVARVDEIA